MQGEQSGITGGVMRKMVCEPSPVPEHVGERRDENGPPVTDGRPFWFIDGWSAAPRGAHFGMMQYLLPQGRLLSGRILTNLSFITRPREQTHT
jgi:hypothetical protein